jgi:phospholipase C
MTSVRDALNLHGQTASLRGIAAARHLNYPVSLRKLTKALPAGRLLHKKIGLDFLQNHLCVPFFNERVRPPFQLRLHSEKHKYGQSTLTVARDDIGIDGRNHYDHTKTDVHEELAKPGERLEISADVGPAHLATYYYYFNDLCSRHIALNVVKSTSPGFHLRIDFETGGKTEIMVDGHFPNIDLTGMRIDIHFGLAVFEPTEDNDKHGWTYKLDVVPFSNPDATAATDKTPFIAADVSVNVSGAPDGTIASKLESTLKEAIFKTLTGEDTRKALGRLVTRWLVGGDYFVVGLACDGETLSFDYIIPPGQVEPFPEQPQTPLQRGRLEPIEHIVVLMMENRSFDHMLGYLSKEGHLNGPVRTDIDGLRGGEVNRYKGQDYPSFKLPDTLFPASPPHGHDPVANQIDGGKMDGFVAAFAKHLDSHQLDLAPGMIMGYYTGEQLPVYDAVAREFLVCQRWFAAHPGPTFCNRFYTLTGRLNRDVDGNFEFDNFTGDAFTPVATKTIFDHLSARGIPWRFYEQRYCTLRLFDNFTFDDEHVVDAYDNVRGFFQAAASGTLPAVSFIDPNFIDEPDGQDNDDGAPADVAAGQAFIGDIVHALMHGPGWSHTLFVVTYDEHGGFYDHVSPLAPEYRTNAKPVSGFDHYGVRVPCLVVSPWVARGQASDVVFDHTSIAKTIIRRFMNDNPPDMGERVAAANDLGMVLQSAVRQDMPAIPRPQPPPAKGIAMKVAPDGQSDDFKEVLRTMRMRLAAKPTL